MFHFAFENPTPPPKPSHDNNIFKIRKNISITGSPKAATLWLHAVLKAASVFQRLFLRLFFRFLCHFLESQLLTLFCPFVISYSVFL
tara:strand:+ start:1540 stop:1800 length:261 start_codon:yes stop_codon:yes gene_type:complete